MSEWKEVTIGDIAILKNGKKRPSMKGPIPVYGGNGIMDTVNTYNDEDCIAIGRVGAYCGCVYLTKGKVWISDNAISAKANNNSDNVFLYYLLGSLNLNRHRIGGAQPLMTQDLIGRIKISLPPIEEQHHIASILLSLDDKIAVNKKICENLEAQAQALFKHWFVDFAPFKDGKFVESELGLIPEGWRVGTLGDLVEIIDNRGKTPPLCSESIYPIIDVKTLTGEGRIVSYEKCSKFVNQDTYNNWFRSGHPQKGDILLSTVGSLAEMKIFMGGLGCIAQNVVALRNPQKSLYLYDYLNWIKKDLLSYNIGSVQPSIKVTHIIKHKVLIPDQNILLRYQDIVKEITEKSYSNNAEITLLSNIRDTLLPKLMSGQINLNEIEKSL